MKANVIVLRSLNNALSYLRVIFGFELCWTSHYWQFTDWSHTMFYCGGVPKRSTGADCKSAGSAFEGSNPSPSTIGRQIRKRARRVSYSGITLAFQANDRSSILLTRSTERTDGQYDRQLEKPLKLSDFKAHIAQLVEHFLGREEVIGSTPIMGST